MIKNFLGLKTRHQVLIEGYNLPSRLKDKTVEKLSENEYSFIIKKIHNCYYLSLSFNDLKKVKLFQVYFIDWLKVNNIRNNLLANLKKSNYSSFLTEPLILGVVIKDNPRFYLLSDSETLTALNDIKNLITSKLPNIDVYLYFVSSYYELKKLHKKFEKN